jgi:hypothetical protein
MALVADPVYTVTYTFQDETGSKSTTQAYIRQGIVIDDVIARANALAAALRNVSNAQLTGYTISRGWTEDAPAGPGGGSRVERKGRTIWLADTYKTRIDIPSIATGQILADGALNRNSAQFLALRAVLLTDFVGDFTDSRGVSLDALAAAYESYTRTTPKRQPTRKLA